MHPALQYDLMQARQHDLLRSAAQRRLAGQARARHIKTARLTRRDHVAVAPWRRVRQLASHLLAS
jgi:hypothetical protein